MKDDKLHIILNTNIKHKGRGSGIAPWYFAWKIRTRPGDGERPVPGPLIAMVFISSCYIDIIFSANTHYNTYHRRHIHSHVRTCQPAKCERFRPKKFSALRVYPLQRRGSSPPRRVLHAHMCASAKRKRANVRSANGIWLQSSIWDSHDISVFSCRHIYRHVKIFDEGDLVSSTMIIRITLVSGIVIIQNVQIVDNLYNIAIAHENWY